MEIFSWLDSWKVVSPMVLTITIGFTIFYITASVIRRLQWQRQLPPGPWGWPLIGHMFDMGSRPDYYFRGVSERFGKVFSVRVGPKLVVVISDPEVVRDAFVKQGSITSERMKAQGGALAYGKDSEWGIALSNGHPWKTARRFVTPALRKVGPSGGPMESLIHDEADHLVEEIRAHADKEGGYDPSYSVVQAVSNVIISLTFGTRFDYTDAIFREIIESVHVIFHHPVSRRSLLELFPFLFFTERARPLREAYAIMKRHMADCVSGAQQKEINEDNVSSLTESILLHLEPDGTDETGETLKPKMLWRVLSDLVMGGTDTTANTLQWAVLIMAHYPDVQQKVYEEIDSVIGTEKNATLRDRDSMPYTHATILEVLRLRPVGPLAVPHLTSHATRFGDYLIPKGTMLIANVLSMHHDAEYWDEPETFKPQRFLNATSSTVIKNQPAYMPFGIGPRVCPGETIAKLELFLIFTRLMQRFSFEFPPGERPSRLDDGVFNEVTLNPRPSKLIVRSR